MLKIDKNTNVSAQVTIDTEDNGTVMVAYLSATLNEGDINISKSIFILFPLLIAYLVLFSSATKTSLGTKFLTSASNLRTSFIIDELTKEYCLLVGKNIVSISGSNSLFI